MKKSAAVNGEQAGPPEPTLLMLTPRQTEIAQLVARGLSDKEIGRALSLSDETVGWHLKEVFVRWGLHCRSAVATRVTQLQSGNADVSVQTSNPRERGG